MDVKVIVMPRRTWTQRQKPRGKLVAKSHPERKRGTCHHLPVTRVIIHHVPLSRSAFVFASAAAVRQTRRTPHRDRLETGSALVPSPSPCDPPPPRQRRSSLSAAEGAQLPKSSGKPSGGSGERHVGPARSLFASPVSARRELRVDAARAPLRPTDAPHLRDPFLPYTPYISQPGPIAKRGERPPPGVRPSSRRSRPSQRAARRSPHRLARVARASEQRCRPPSALDEGRARRQGRRRRTLRQSPELTDFLTETGPVRPLAPAEGEESLQPPGFTPRKKHLGGRVRNSAQGRGKKNTPPP